MIELTVSPDEGKTRLDALVRKHGELSQKKARMLCAFGGVTINGVCADAATRVRPGQQIRFDDQQAELTLRLGMPVAYQDDEVLVVHKPPGLAVHTGPLIDLSVAEILERELPGSGLAQRLDRDASGLLLIGKTQAALSSLGKAMERGEIGREYEAVVHGNVEQDQRTIDLALRITDEPQGNLPKTVVDEQGLPSVSHVTVLGRRDGASHVNVRLETGRTHQIRAHLAAVGHPLLGDSRYGDPKANEHARTTFGVHRTLLHCCRLEFALPSSGESQVVTTATEPDFARLFPVRRNRA